MLRTVTVKQLVAATDALAGLLLKSFPVPTALGIAITAGQIDESLKLARAAEERFVAENGTMVGNGQYVTECPEKRDSFLLVEHRVMAIPLTAVSTLADADLLNLLPLIDAAA
jgi:hypothetical protein